MSAKVRDTHTEAGLTLRPLGSLVEYIGSGISRAFYEERIGVPVLRSNNVKNGEIVLNDLKYWHREDPAGANLEKVRPRPGDVLVNFVNGSQQELGKAAVYRGDPHDCIVSTNFFIVRVNRNSLLPEYLNYFLQSPAYSRWLSRTCGFSGQGSFNREQIRSLEVPVLTIFEQQRVVTTLGQLDEVRRLIRKLVDVKRTVKRGLMQQLLAGRKRFRPFHDRPWTLHRFDTLCEELSDRNGQQLGADVVMGVIKGVGFEPMRDRVRGKGDIARYKVVPPGAFAYNPMRLNIGSIAFNDLGRSILVSPDYVVFRARSDVAAPYFVNQLRYSAYWSGFMKRAGAGSVRVRIYFRDLARLRVPAPALDEQERIAEVLQLIDLEITQLERLQRLTEDQKIALLSRILSGDLSISSS